MRMYISGHLALWRKHQEKFSLGKCLKGMASSLLRLLVILLGFYHLICLNAVPLGSKYLDKFPVFSVYNYFFSLDLVCYLLFRNQNLRAWKWRIWCFGRYWRGTFIIWTFKPYIRCTYLGNRKLLFTDFVSFYVNIQLNREEVGEENIINGRMDVEVNDYPGSGANNRHTPRQQLGRGCVDC